MNRYFIFILTVVLIVNCSPKSNQEQGALKIDLDSAEDIPASLYFEEIGYTLLKDPENSPFIKPFKIVLEDNLILVQDRDRHALYIFDHQGELVRMIAGEGKGPGEYFQMDDFQLKGDRIFIQDTYLRKIVEYSFEGEFIQEERNEFHNTNFHKGTDYTLYYVSNNPDFERFNFIRTSRGNVEGFMDIKEGFEKTVKTLLPRGFSVHPTSGKIFYPVPHSSEVVVFDKEGRLEETLRFDFGPYQIQDSDRLGERSIVRQKIMDNNLVSYMSVFFPMGGNYLLSVSQGNRTGYNILLDSDFGVIGVGNKFINDLDGMPFGRSPWTYGRDSIVFLVHSMSFYNDYVKTFAGQKVKVEPGNVHDFFQKNKTLLQDDKWVLAKLRVK